MAFRGLLFLTILLVSACGFHLRESTDFPPVMQRTYVSSSYDLIRTRSIIEKQLVANNVELVAQDDASALLRILKEEVDRRIISIDDQGKLREYALGLQITFDVQDKKDNFLLKNEVVSLSRDFVFDKTDVLGEEQEAQNLLDEMRQDVARLLLLRLQSITK